MSWQDCPAADGAPVENAADPVEMVIVPRTSDLGGFEVARVLPFRKRRMVGPFIFLDQIGPSRFAPGTGLDVGAHPHIGLATVTYLFEGQILHRDSLGNELPIRPGEVNWMTAGRGIAHSERTPDALRAGGPRLAGMQAWVALPQRHEEIDPAFAHHDDRTLPIIEGDGVRLRIVAGAFAGGRSPVETLSETLYADVSMAAGSRLPVDAEQEERALHVFSGAVSIDSHRLEAGRMAVLKPGAAVTVRCEADARLMLLGGAPMDGPRHIWWNFVSSRKEQIEQAKEDWKAGRFDPVPGETDPIPLPG
jgi:hypothetical protein